MGKYSINSFWYFFLLILFFPGISAGQIFKSLDKEEDGISISLDEGRLKIIPLTENAIRIRYLKEMPDTLAEFVFTSEMHFKDFSVSESDERVELITSNILVRFDKKQGSLTFLNNQGVEFLRERAGKRKLNALPEIGSWYTAEQSFESPADEALFGLGQFQDGQFNLKGVARRLIQVNSQIALPFVYSSKGYGLLWHQYGLTDFNPTDQEVFLKKQEDTQKDGKSMMDATTSSGTQKIRQDQSMYDGRFAVPEEGEYSLFLDLGEMGNRQLVTIDGKPVIDQANLWLPPSIGTKIFLNAGEHHVQVICKSSNKPRLSWKRTDNTTTFCSPDALYIDYVVFYGPSADQVIKSYRDLSGPAPLLPKWAYGFWQCRERYSSGQELVNAVKEFRKRDIPLDVIVQDWQYWGKNSWGVPQFDSINYSNPAGFIKEIHDLHAHFNISIWSNPDKNSQVGKDFVSHNLYIKNTKWLDYFNPETRTSYWKTLNDNLFSSGVDSWWMDATEPENDALKGETTYLGRGDLYRLTYPLMVCKSVYEGQRSVTADKRVCILTRSAFPGQQRYASINWSGDIGGNWDSFRRQISAGLNYSVCGMPYWTTDIGGFFRPGRSQYTDEKYHELLLRWLQWGAFNPIFRVHGYQTETEPWKYGTVVEDNFRKTLNLRYQLLPYIYSEAWKITSGGSTLMRPLVMDYREDSVATTQPFEYMFGNAFLVAPVTEPGVSGREVYLPLKDNWFDFYPGTYYTGGQSIFAEAPLDRIPLFVRAGSIIPIGKSVQYTGQQPEDTLEIRIYSGNNVRFELYEDEGDNYNYEKGLYSIVPFIWNEKLKVLTIENRKGSFPGYLHNRVFILRLYQPEMETSGKYIPRERVVSYSGKKRKIKWD
ncbi:MAG: glycoside hydrolase family 31 protein [Bacteroidales bacterium]